MLNELENSTIHPHSMADYVCGDDTNDISGFHFAE